MDNRGEIRRLWEIVEPVVVSQGMELTELEFRREPRGWVLRLYIDRAGGVTLEHCTSVSREVGDVLDAEDPILHPYVLEVSSPGLDRPVRKPEDFQRFEGQRIKIRLAEPLEGRRSVEGILRGVHQGMVRVEAGGGVLEVALSQVGKARLIHSWGKDSGKE
jgi:ribosome maturation factor RimP